MRIESRITKLQALPENRTEPDRAPAVSSKNRVISWLIALVVGGVAFLLTLAVGDHFLRRLPPELVGKWEVVETNEPQGKGAIIEFFRDGTMRRAVEVPGGHDVLEGQAAVQGDYLLVTVVQPMTRRRETSRQLLLDLSDNQLVTGDHTGNITILKRAR